MKSIATITALLTAAAAGACCGVGPDGKPVTFGGQTNIVIWNSQTHTEHFIRNARFETKALDLGFIAPTPTKPDLASVDPDAFRLLARLQPPPLFPPAEVGAKAIAGVSVVQRVHVGGYDATTLLATDANALADWMQKNGYATDFAIQDWTKFYILRHWYLTAFKVENADRVAETGTIRMSFRTEKPFNPYRVPSDNIPMDGPTPGLHVYFIGDGAYDANIGSQSPWQNADWNVGVPSETVSLLAKDLKLNTADLPSNPTVESFTDPSFPRPVQDDIYFQPAPPSKLPLAAAVFALVLIALAIRSRLRPART